MTIKKYMSSKFTSLGLVLRDADLADMGVWDEDVLITEETIKDAHVAFVKSIPMMLLRPTSVSEGGVSMSKADRQNIIQFYRSECKRLGLTPDKSLVPTVRFL